MDGAHDKETHRAAKPPQQIMTLLRLPGEIRNRIYRYAIVQDTPIVLYSTSTAYGRCKFFSNAICNLSSVCRTTREEVRSIFYEENTFTFTAATLSPAAVATFERVCGSSAGKISSVTFKLRLLNLRPGLVHLRFCAKKTERGVDIRVGPQMEAVSEWEYMGNTSRICCCNVLAIARTCRVSDASNDDACEPLMTFLKSYAESFTARGGAYHGTYAPATLDNRNRTCDDCGKDYIDCRGLFEAINVRNKLCQTAT